MINPEQMLMYCSVASRKQEIDRQYQALFRNQRPKKALWGKFQNLFGIFLQCHYGEILPPLLYLLSYTLNLYYKNADNTTDRLLVGQSNFQTLQTAENILKRAKPV